MPRQPTTGAMPATSPTAHQGTRHQTPVVSSPLSPSGYSPQTGRSGTEHGGAGAFIPLRLRSRRVLFGDVPRRLLTGGSAWPS